MNTELMKFARWNEGHYETHCDYHNQNARFDWDNIVSRYPRGWCDDNTEDEHGNWCNPYGWGQRNSYSVHKPKNFRL